MSKRCKKLEEIKNMFKDIDINFDDINDNGIEEFINIIKLTKDDRYQLDLCQVFRYISLILLLSTFLVIEIKKIRHSFISD